MEWAPAVEYPREEPKAESAPTDAAPEAFEAPMNWIAVASERDAPKKVNLITKFLTQIKAKATAEKMGQGSQ